MVATILVIVAVVAASWRVHAGVFTAELKLDNSTNGFSPTSNLVRDKEVGEEEGGGEGELDRTAFNSHIFDMMCNQNCSGKCEYRSRLQYSGCYCDEACERLGDCCITYEQYCKEGGTPVTSHNWTSLVKERNVLKTSCLQIRLKNEHNYFKIVDGCTQEESIDSEDENIYKCLKIPENFEEYTQVVYRGVIYKNYFCVKCNHPQSLDVEILIENVEINCYKNSVKALEIFEKEGLSAFFDFSILNCIHFQKWNLPDSRTRFYCKDNFNYAERKCFKSDESPRDFDYYETMCSRYRAEFGREHSQTRFVNPHCRKCSRGIRPRVEDKFYCTRGRIGSLGGFKKYNSFPNFSVFLDFKLAKKNAELKIASKEVCADHDIVTDSCITSSCPTGLIRLESNDCVRYDARPSRQLLSARHAQSFRIVAVLSNVTVPNLVIELRPTLQDLREYNIFPQVSPLAMSLRMREYQPCREIGDIVLAKVLSNYYGEYTNDLVCFTKNIPKDMYHHHIRHGFNYISSPHNDLKNHRVHFIFLNQDDKEFVNHDRKCKVGSVEKDFAIYGDENVRLLGYDLTGKTYTDEFLINSTSQKYQLENTPLILASEYLNNEKSISKKIAIICAPEIILCKTRTFRKDKFAFITHDQVTLSDYRLDNCLQIDGDSVVSVSNGEIIVACVEKLETLAICRSTQSIVKQTLSIIGVTISIVCLAATIVTYTIHSTLRAGPGICVLSLSISIFMAQLIFLTNTSALGNTVACGFIGALQHYTWLSAFCWMNVMAVDIWKVFSTPTGSLSSKGKERKKFILYSCYAWGVPLIFVFTLYIVYLSKESSSHYGGIDSCFIVGKSIIYLFAIPLFIIICSNCIFFGLTIISLRRTLNITKEVRKVERSQLAINIKMASLMGLTWLFGFLANIPKMEWLFYPFIVCNAMQGVAIFISFALNSRARVMWKKLFQERVNRYQLSGSASGSSSTCQETSLRDRTKDTAGQCSSIQKTPNRHLETTTGEPINSISVPL